MNYRPPAHRIPNEVLDTIAREANALAKTDLRRFSFGTLCLVHRRWAHICRPVLWWVVQISSETRLHTFCALLDMPTNEPLPSLALLIHKIAYADAVPGKAPWIHRAHPVIAYRLPAVKIVGFTISRADGVQAENVRSLHAGLPRLLPSQHLPLVYIMFSNVRFESRRALLRLLASNTFLESVVCRKVTWEKEEQLSPSVVLSSRLCEVQVVQDSGDEAWWWLQPLISHRRRPNNQTTRSRQESQIMHPRELETVKSMVSCLLSGLHLSSVVFKRREWPKNSGYILVIRVEYSDDKSDILPVQPGISAFQLTLYYSETQLRYDGLIPTHGPTNPVVTIKRVRLEIMDKVWKWKKYWTLDTWKYFVQHVHTLSEFRILFMEFLCAYDLQTFYRKYKGAINVPKLLQRLQLFDRETKRSYWLAHVIQQIEKGVVVSKQIES